MPKAKPCKNCSHKKSWHKPKQPNKCFWPNVNAPECKCPGYESAEEKEGSKAPWHNKPSQIEQISSCIKNLLLALGLDVHDANFKDTPKRVAKMYLEVFDGVQGLARVEDILSTTFPSNYKGIIIHKNILAFGFCPHHLLPVEYSVSLGYIAEKTVGLSKIPRAVELLAKRPVLQETFTHEISDMLVQHLNAKGVIVVVQGKHSCMRIRGVRTLSDVVITSDIKGVFENSPAARAEAMQLLS